MADPIIKWVGGKRALLTNIRPRCPNSFEKYHEPFVGGGAVFFDLEPAGGTLNDLNRSLVSLYEMVREYPDRLIEENRSHTYDEEYYYDARAEFNDLRQQESPTTSKRIREASLLVYLVQTGFNGLYRENSSGEYNVPFGEHTDPNFLLQDRIHTGSEVLEGMTLHNEDFEYVVEVAEKGDFVYFDPPYQPVSSTADFTEYQSDGFEKSDQRRLRDVAVELDDIDVTVLISNSPPVRELYDDYTSFEIDMVQAPRDISSDASSRGDVAEVLIHNVPQAQLSTLTSF
jgi:DNA adenine methylase